MSTENPHVTAILAAVDAISDAVEEAGRTDIPMIGEHYDAILGHADALARRLAEAEARCEAYKQGWEALGPFCTKQFRGDDPSITDEELHAFCVARRTIWELEHGDLPTDGSDDDGSDGPQP